MHDLCLLQLFMCGVSQGLLRYHRKRGENRIGEVGGSKKGNLKKAGEEEEVEQAAHDIAEALVHACWLTSTVRASGYCSPPDRFYPLPLFSLKMDASICFFGVVWRKVCNNFTELSSFCDSLVNVHFLFGTQGRVGGSFHQHNQ